MKRENNVIYAITNLDAEDLGSSIIKTFYDRDEAYSEMELIESGNRPDFFMVPIVDMFEIKLPE